MLIEMVSAHGPSAMGRLSSVSSKDVLYSIEVFHKHGMVVVVVVGVEVEVEVEHKTLTHATPESLLLANTALKMKQVKLNRPEGSNRSVKHGKMEVKDGWHMERSSRKAIDVDTQVRHE